MINLSAQVIGGALGLQLLAFWNYKFVAAQAATHPVDDLGCLGVDLWLLGGSFFALRKRLQDKLSTCPDWQLVFI